ncbi:hypothetical protein [Mesorhizobium sp. CO1-1-11]|uniref:hypothetical protein n=2 Tax=Mesorhizobium TaxID=68287 RepID=UPI0029623C17|nr:hypothetical protein [Mesorhizobium sp. CO1-1-11]
MRILARPSKAERSVLRTPCVLAHVPEHSGALARRRRYAVGKPDWFVAHLRKDSIRPLDGQGICSFSVLMAHDPIDTLGKATRHNMLVKAECSCGNIRYCRSADLMMVYGGGVDPLKLKFDCNRCKPSIKITLLEVHPEHLPKRLMIHKPMKVDGKITWYTERFRG